MSRLATEYDNAEILKSKSETMSILLTNCSPNLKCDKSITGLGGMVGIIKVEKVDINQWLMLKLVKDGIKMNQV